MAVTAGFNKAIKKGKYLRCESRKHRAKACESFRPAKRSVFKVNALNIDLESSDSNASGKDTP